MLLAASVSPAADAKAAAAAGRHDPPLPGQQSQQPVHGAPIVAGLDGAGMASARVAIVRVESRWRRARRSRKTNGARASGGTARHMVLGRRTFGILPSNPRCKFCSIPFRGPGGFVLRHLSEKYGPVGQEPEPLPTMRDRARVRGGDGGRGRRLVPVRRRPSLERSRQGDGDLRVHASDAALLRGRHRGPVRLTRRCSTSSWATRWSASSSPSWRARSTPAWPWRPLGRSSTPRATGRRRARGSRSARACTPAPRSSATSPEVRRASSPRSATRSTWRRTSPPRRAAGEILITEAVGASLETEGLERRHLSLKGHELDALVITIDERGPAEAGVA